MRAYLHHIIFEPLSMWEQFKVSCLVMLLVLAIVAFICLCIFCVRKFR